MPLEAEQQLPPDVRVQTWYCRKRQIGELRSAGGGNDHFLAVLESSDLTDTREALIEFFSKPISGFTPNMIEKGSFEVMPEILEMLEQENVKFVRNSDGPT